MGDPETYEVSEVPPPEPTLIASIESFFSWVAAAFSEGRDHSGDFRKSLGLSQSDLSNWKRAIWKGKNASSRQINVTAELLATLSYSGTHPHYRTKGVEKKVRGSAWEAYATKPKAPDEAQWQKIASDRIRQLETYYESLIRGHQNAILRRAALPRENASVNDCQAAFVKALTEYVAMLVQQGKMTTVLHIRESMSHLLHLIGGESNEKSN